MTLRELKTKYPDIILDELSWDDLIPLANGAALFYVSLSGGNKPQDDRKVLWAGHILTMGMTAGNNTLVIARPTEYGNIRADAVPKTRLDRSVAFYQTRPIAAHDRRNMEPWTRWN